MKHCASARNSARYSADPLSRPTARTRSPQKCQEDRILESDDVAFEEEAKEGEEEEARDETVRERRRRADRRRAGERGEEREARMEERGAIDA